MFDFTHHISFTHIPPFLLDINFYFLSATVLLGFNAHRRLKELRQLVETLYYLFAAQNLEGIKKQQAKDCHE